MNKLTFDNVYDLVYYIKLIMNNEKINNEKIFDIDENIIKILGAEFFEQIFKKQFKNLLSSLKTKPEHIYINGRGMIYNVYDGTSDTTKAIVKYDSHERRLYTTYLPFYFQIHYDNFVNRTGLLDEITKNDYLTSYTDDEYRIDIANYLKNSKDTIEIYNKYIIALLYGYPYEIELYKKAKNYVIECENKNIFLKGKEEVEKQIKVLNKFFNNLLNKKQKAFENVIKMADPKIRDYIFNELFCKGLLTKEETQALITKFSTTNDPNLPSNN